MYYWNIMILLQWKETALHQAAKKGQVQVVETLHRLGADVNVFDNVSIYLSASESIIKCSDPMLVQYILGLVHRM